MKQYRLKTVIPTESDASGLQYDTELYYASHTNVFKHGNKTSLHSKCHYTIKAIIIKNYTFILTNKYLYFNKDNSVLGTLKTSSQCMAVSNKYILLGTHNYLEVWVIPREFKFTLFNLHKRISGHSAELTSISLLDEFHAITTSLDCTVRLFNIHSGEYRTLCGTRTTPLNAHILSDREVAIVCIDGLIIFVDIGIENDKKQGANKGVSSTDNLGKNAAQDTGNTPTGSYNLPALVLTRHKMFLNDTILCSSSFNDTIAVCVNKKAMVIHGREVVFESTLEFSVSEICLYNGMLALKGRAFIGVYDISSDVFTMHMNLSTITCMALNSHLSGYVITGCADKVIRVFDNADLVCELSDPKSTHGIFSVHSFKNSVLCVSNVGHISVFDMVKQYCYRSFCVPLRICATAISEELLFLADFDTYEIKVVDLQRSKVIDELRGHEGPVNRILWFHGHLYSLGYDNVLRKWNIYNSTVVSVSLEKMATGLCIKNKYVCVATDNEAILYDEDLEYIKGLAIFIKGRSRKEKFVRHRAIEHMDFSFDGQSLIVGGKSNYIQIVDIETNDTYTVKVSSNKEWENYKETLGYDSGSPYDKTKVIEVRDIKYSTCHTKFYVLSREGVRIYDTNSIKFLPVELDLKVSPDAIIEYLGTGEWLKAAVSAVKLNMADTLRVCVQQIPEASINGVMKYFPDKLIDRLSGHLFRLLEDPLVQYKALLWTQHLTCYHKGIKGYDTVKKVLNETLLLGKQNFYMIKNVLANRHKKSNS